MSEARHVVRKMTREEVPFAIGLAAQEGWSPGAHDTVCFYESLFQRPRPAFLPCWIDQPEAVALG